MEMTATNYSTYQRICGFMPDDFRANIALAEETILREAASELSVERENVALHSLLPLRQPDAQITFGLPPDDVWFIAVIHFQRSRPAELLGAADP